MLYEMHLWVETLVVRSKSDLECQPVGLLRRDSAAHMEVPDVVYDSLDYATHLNWTKLYGPELK